MTASNDDLVIYAVNCSDVASIINFRVNILIWINDEALN